MNFFRNKINILLISILILSLVGVGFVLFFEPTAPVYAINFTNLTEREIIEWATNNEVESLLTIEYDYSDSIEKGNVISQSIKEDDEINQNLIIVISNGIDPSKLITLPIIDENTTKDILDEYFNNNAFTNIEYKYVDSELPIDTIIEINKTGEVRIDENIIVTISNGLPKNTGDVVIIPDFSNYTYKQIQNWGTQNSIKVSFDTNVSDTIARNKVISQSIKSGTEVKKNSSIKIVISDGKGIVIPDFTNKTKEDVEKWKIDNGIETITYTEEFSNTKEAGIVLSNKPKTGVTISVDYPVSVVISKGKKITIEVKKGYEGLSESDFIKTIEDLGLKTKDDKETFYSEKYAKDTIYAYVSGTYEKGDTVIYSKSLGIYVFDDSKYNNKSFNDANTLAKNEILMNAFSKFETTSDLTNDSSKLGKVYGCSLNGGIVSCKLGVVDASKFNNKTKAEASSFMNNISVSYEWGDIDANKANKTYGCEINEGTKVKCFVYRESMNVDSYNGISKDAALNKLSSYKNTYGTGSITFNEVETVDNSLIGKTNGCQLNSYKITCNLYVGVKTGDIMGPSLYTTYTVNGDYEQTKNNLLNGPFKNFTNCTVVGDEGSDKTAGTLLSINVNGTNISTGMTVPLTTKIIITLSNRKS